MKATEAKLQEFLKKSPQFVVPIYLRTYSWTYPNLDQSVLEAHTYKEITAATPSTIIRIRPHAIWLAVD